MVKKINVSLIILNFNTGKMTLDQLTDISKLNTDGLKVTCVVVDNNSSDDSEKLLSNQKLPNMDFKFIKSPKNLGFAGGNNIGIKSALKNKTDYVIVMNNDLILEKDLVNKMVEFMENNLTVGIASPKIYFAKGYEFHKNRYNKKDLGKVIWYAGGIIDRNNVYTSHRGVDEVDNGQFDETIETDTASGACMIVRSEVFKKVGLFDESLFLYWEDADFSERVRRSGFNVVYFAKAHLWHKVSESTGGSGGTTNDYFLTRNRYYFSLKYSNLRTKIAVIRDTIKLVFTGRPWQKRGAMDSILGRKGMGQWKYR